jgi:hypothetical protein
VAVSSSAEHDAPPPRRRQRHHDASFVAVRRRPDAHGEDEALVADAEGRRRR